MNMTPVIRQLGDADFKKMLRASSTREKFYMRIARHDPAFEYHIDLPKDRDQGTEGTRERENPLADMASWLADEKRFQE